MINILTYLADMAPNSNVNGDGTGVIAALMVFLFFAAIFVAFVLVGVFWVLSLIHLIQHEDVKDRTLWLVLLFVVGGVIGPIYYFAVKKPYDKSKSSKKLNKRTR